MNPKDFTLKTIVVTPVYNDWLSFQELLKKLQKPIISEGVSIISIVAVNDGSIEPINKLNTDIPITILNLNNNMGHQRAISVGLSYVCDEIQNFDGVIVMDCDGEDRPEDLEKIIGFAKSDGLSRIVFAKREKRSEGLLFKLFYKLYKSIFKVLTHQRLDFGNFSFIPKSLLLRVVSIPELWNHYSGGIMKSKLPYTSIGVNRGKRYHGQSKMNFQNLVLHGLSAISIYMDVVSIRLLIVAFACSFVVVLGLILILYLALFTSLPIPGWSSLTGLLLINILAIFILTTFLILLFQLNQKAIVKFPPKSFYKDFILSIRQLK